MTRGLISGVLWGSALMVLSLWLLSQVSGVVGLLSEPPQDVAIVAPAGGDAVTAADAGDTPVAPGSQASPSTDPSRQGTALASANTDAAPQADTAPATVPSTGTIAAGQTSPAQGSAPVLQAPAETGLNPGVPGASPSSPATEGAPQVASGIPEVANVTTGSTAPSAPEIPVVTAGALPATSAEPVPGVEPVQPGEPVAETVPESDFSAPRVVATPPPPPPPAAVIVEPEPDAVPTGPETDNADAAPAVVDAGNLATILRPNRLPTIGETAPPPEPAEEEEPEAPLTGPAIEIYAEEFENPEGRPMMAIVLLVDGDAADAAIASEPLPFPVSYVVDASKENATRVMTAYRAAGREVVALTPLPEGAAPRDVEVAFQSYLTAVPEAVAVMDVPDAVFQSGRSVATQVAQALAASGHGMITYSRGLNAATQVAEREGVPAALVFRVFDTGDRDRAGIKRFLDQAAFRAGQQSGVILVGRNRPETIAALLEWGLGNRASRVALAPVSAVLRAR